jgi:RND superfamily putative drug exporter
MAGRSDSQENKDLVKRVRSDLVPAYFKTLPGVAAYVTGKSAIVMDMVNHYTDVLPLVFAFVLSLSFMVLLVAFRSIVIPVKAIVLNLLSTGAAYGAVVLVFQDGYFSDELGFTPGTVIESFLPAFLFTILFGLSMDYHLFVLTRIKEEKDKGASSVEADARGISITSGTITSAAAIMVMVFAVFVTLRLMVVRQLGLGLSVAVFIDATLIRCVVLPSTMKLLGDLNWYLPPFLRWVPRVTIESELEEEAALESSGGGEEKEEILALS